MSICMEQSCSFVGGVRVGESRRRAPVKLLSQAEVFSISDQV